MRTSNRDLVTTVAGADSEVPESVDGEQMLLIAMSGNSVGQIYNLSREKILTVIGRDDHADVQVLDAEISRRHAAIRHDATRGCFLIGDLNSSNGTKLNDEPLTAERALNIGDKIRLGSITVLRVSLATETEAKYARKMYQAVLRDGLTGAFNRRYLDDRLKAELAFARRHRTPLAVLLADLDHFKRVNDDFGHQAGDHVLQEFVELLNAEVRTEDVVARYGGEEFAILCRDTDERRAGVLAERLRSAVEQTDFEYVGQIIPVTVSIGIADSQAAGADSPELLVDAADKALYAAKNDGRNCWRSATGPALPKK